MNNILTILISFVVEFANLSFNQFYFIFLFAPVVLLFFVHKNILINLEFFECVVKLYCNSKCSRASTNVTLIARFVTAKTITTVLYRGGSAHRCGKIPIFQIIAVVYIYRTSSAILTRSHEGN